ncbi:MAG: sigma 54-interacting transcriptional regulator [Gammaproteobacteria bacterium]|nr:sigma 54-interacting transcriptional regulator [Gammaproteobacteria bacterium]MDE0272713.1 sigma 54-interacting transcriptional regulator [Gammaproteobacteria bacterium]
MEPLSLPLADPTRHADVYAAMRDRVVPRLASRSDVHVNISPGTPAMHAAWIILHASGALPPGTRLWSSQFNPATKRSRVDPVEFPITTYLAEVRKLGWMEPNRGMYRPDAQSAARRAALERLARYARVPGMPMLVLGERGTGKTRLVETLVAELKARAGKVVTLACGGLDSSLADSLLFGHRRGAFTGAVEDRPGLLAKADAGILFLDEVQDLPKAAQRKLVRVFQERHRRYRPLGGDAEVAVDVELICASNLDDAVLRDRLDPDLYDRISHLTVRIPPIRECREDIADGWRAVWRELRRDERLPGEAPWNSHLASTLADHDLPGNLRDLQRLAALLMAWWSGDAEESIGTALANWNLGLAEAELEWDGRGGLYGSGSRQEFIRRFRHRLALWSKERHGTWRDAAAALQCDEKTLRQDAALRAQHGNLG